jgi:CRISPR-associated endonuclease Csn1
LLYLIFYLSCPIIFKIFYFIKKQDIMKKVLGLDIGTNSIGWAFIYEDDDQNSDILDMGVRIISSDSKHATEFEKGQAITLNATRREKRGIRRGNQRYKLRHQRLKAALLALGMMPNDYLLKDLSALQLFELRAMAVQGDKLTLDEIGRVLIHLNQKRGYKSNRKANAEEKESTEANNEETSENKPEKKKGYLDLIMDRESLIKSKGLTIGQFFFQKLQNTEGPPLRIKQQIFNRQSYIAEFDLIWEKQKAFYPNILTEKNRLLLRDEIIYFQRRLKSQKHLVSDCRFEKGHKAIPRSAPLYQTFNIWQIVNNVRITNIKEANKGAYNQHGERSLTDIERKKLFAYLDDNKDALPRKVLKEILILNPTDHKLNYEKLEGNKTKSRLKIVGEEILNNTDKLNDLWHKVYSIEEPENLIKALQNSFGFDEALAKAVTKINLPADYGSVSARAIKRLLPYLEKGLDYVNACKAVSDATGLTQYNMHHVTLEENMQKTLEKQISLMERGSLRNPVVEQILNQVINLVNSIINTPQYLSAAERQSGEFEIRVELARELKANAEARQRMDKNVKKGRDNNDRIKEELEKAGVRPSPRNIEKYKLWEEQGKVSPYTFQPIEPIPLSKLFDENLYEIEHVIPRSRFFDDSMSNKVIAERSINQDKGNMTGYEYMDSKGKLAEYIKFVNDNRNFSKAKRERLLAKTVPEDFITRQLKETQYITKAIVVKLKEVCHRVYVSSGAITEYLRDTWGLNDVLQKLNWSKYESAGKVFEFKDKDGRTIHKIRDWSKRDDHRHHAIDALIVAFTRQGMIQSMNTLNAQSSTTSHFEFKERGYKFAQPMPGFVKRAMEMTDRILISHRQKRKVMSRHTNTLATGHKQVTYTPRGELHKQSVYGKIKRYQVVEITSRFRNWDLITHDSLKNLVMQRLNEANGDPAIAFKNYTKNPIWLDAAKTKPLLNVSIWKEDFVIKYTLNDSFKEKDVSYIVDDKVRKVVAERFRQSGGDSKKAFREPLYMDDAQKIPITSVRCFTGLSNLIALHDNHDFVVSGNNHHLAIYQNEEGKKDSEIVSFWTAVERKRQGVGVIQNEHPEKGRLVQTFAINDLFIIGLDTSEIDIFEEKNYALVSKYLYRVQKIFDFDLWFRHHLETRVDEISPLAREIKKFYQIKSIGGFERLNAIKVKINSLGKLEK